MAGYLTLWDSLCSIHTKDVMLMIFSSFESFATEVEEAGEQTVRQYIDDFLETELSTEEDEYECDNGPTGHGDICWSDADPGL
jgi:hypothetical protein